jgi:ribose transport system ATP-binding protein
VSLSRILPFNLDTQLFATTSLTKVYAAVAVEDVSLEFRAGEVHALLGANGAGKSTFSRILAGLVQPTRGSMELNGREYAPASKADAEALGVQIVQQELNLIPTLDVAHNLFLNRLPHRWGRLQSGKLHADARVLLDRFGLHRVATHEFVGRLGVGEKQMIEIASTLDRDCRVLILDEPTAALSVRESECLFEKLDDAKRRGVAILYISHRLEEVLQIADRITILRDGRWVGTWSRGELTISQMVHRMTYGPGADGVGASAVPETMAKSSKQDGAGRSKLLLQVSRLTSEPRVRSIDLCVHQGEIVGIAGLVGAGRSELLKTLFGAQPAESGELVLPDGRRSRPFTSPRQAVGAGIVLIGEDRKLDGLLLSQPVGLNIALPSLMPRGDSIWRYWVPLPWGWYRRRKVGELAARYREELGIRYQDAEQPVATLSGGNQQKVVLAKWLERGGSVFLFDEPTRGIDVSAREVVYGVMKNLAAAGRGLIVVSSDLEELIGIADRIGVMSNGRLMTMVPGPDYRREELVQAMFAGFQADHDGVSAGDSQSPVSEKR